MVYSSSRSFIGPGINSLYGDSSYANSMPHKGESPDEYTSLMNFVTSTDTIPSNIGTSKANANEIAATLSQSVEGKEE